jgi:hypothetical protein
MAKLCRKLGAFATAVRTLEVELQGASRPLHLPDTAVCSTSALHPIGRR